MLAVRPKLMRLQVPVLAGKCKQRNCVIKILTARRKRRSLGIAMLVLQIFLESRSTVKC